MNRPLAAVVLLVIGGYVVLNWQNRPAVQQRAAQAQALAEPAKPPPPPDPKDRFEISKMDWKLSGFGTVAIVSLTFNNQNTFSVKDPLIACSFHGKSGTLIDTKRQTLFEAFAPSKKRTVKNISLGFVNPQAARAGCRILSVEQAL